MFTWICPQCGREVPPAYNECPDCAAKVATTTSVATDAPAQPTPLKAPPMPPSEPPPAADAPPPSPPPRRQVVVRSSMPGWLVTIFVAIVLVGVVGGVYLFIRMRAGNETAAAEAPSVAMETPAAPASTATGPHQFAKYIEVTGVRIIEEKQRAQVRFVLVNHSQAELGALEGVVTLRAAKVDAPVATFNFKVASLGPWESKDIVAALETKLRAYEIPDWQFVRAEVRLTSQ